MENKKTIQLFLLIVFLFIGIKQTNAQITTNREPVSFTLQRQDTKIIEEKSDTIVITPPNLEKVYEEDAVRAKSNYPFQRIAVPITMNINTGNAGVWRELPDGGKLWEITLFVKDAKMLNLSFDKFWLPPKGLFFLYNKETGHIIGAITSEFLQGSKEMPAVFTIEPVRGEKLTLEYYQPADETDNPIISVSKVHYGYRDESDFIAMERTGLSYININCPEGQPWQNEKRAVARMNIGNPNGTFAGSGALINNTRGDFKPYFLTAGHVIASNFYTPDAFFDEIIFYWNDEYPGCEDVGRTHRTTFGARLVAHNTKTDFALLELIEDPRNLPGFTPYYLGWSRSTTPAQKAVSIHHPNNLSKKISFEDNPLESNAGIVRSTDATPPFEHPKHTLWRAVFDRGKIHKGSSGSPLMDLNGRIVGQLSGISEDGMRVYSGRFDVSWNGNTPDSRLKDWLDPYNTNVQMLDSKDLLSISGASVVCNQDTYNIVNYRSGVVQWSTSNSNLTILSGQGTSRATFERNGDGLCYINATIQVGNQSIVLQPFPVSCGEPVITGITGLQHFPLGGMGTYIADVENADDITYHWSVSPSVPISFAGKHAYIIFPSTNGDYTITLTVSNSCGSTNFYYFVATGENEPFKIYPNPTTDVVNVQLPNGPEKSGTLSNGEIEGRTSRPGNTGIYEIQLWSSSAMLRRYTTDQPVYQISVSGLPPGIYFVRIIKDGQTHTKKLIKR